MAYLSSRSTQPTIEADHQLLEQEHDDDHDDQPHDPMEHAVELHEVAKCDRQRLQDHELRPEQDQPGNEELERRPRETRLARKKAKYVMLGNYRPFEQELQQNGREEERGEIVDVDLARIFIE